MGGSPVQKLRACRACWQDAPARVREGPERDVRAQEMHLDHMRQEGKKLKRKASKSSGVPCIPAFAHRCAPVIPCLAGVHGGWTARRKIASAQLRNALLPRWQPSRAMYRSSSTRVSSYANPQRIYALALPKRCPPPKLECAPQIRSGCFALFLSARCGLCSLLWWRHP